MAKIKFERKDGSYFYKDKTHDFEIYRTIYGYTLLKEYHKGDKKHDGKGLKFDRVSDAKAYVEMIVM